MHPKASKSYCHSLLQLKETKETSAVSVQLAISVHCSTLLKRKKTSVVSVQLAISVHYSTLFKRRKLVLLVYSFL